MKSGRSPLLIAPLLLLGAAAALGAGCAKGEECVSARDVRISWDANRDKDVNVAGGGYRILYSASPDFSGATGVDLPYSSGTGLPTSTTLPQLGCGQWHVRVTAYSALNATGGSTDIQVAVE